MNPHLLTLALTTPLEQLLELPNAVRIAACAREDLQHFSTEQLQRMLANMDAAITDTVTLAQMKHGGELVSRHEQRDLDWFIEVTNQAEWPRLRSAPATDCDYLRLLALYKLGVVIEATADTPSGVIIRPAVDALIAAYDRGAEWLDALNEYLHANYLFLREYFAQHLPQYPVLPLEGTYLVWADCRAAGLASDELAERLLAEGRLRVNSGTMYGAAGAGFIRLNIACPRTLLAEELERLRKVLELRK